MTRHTIAAVLAAVLVLLAGCVGGPSGVSAPDADQGDAAPSGEPGTVAVYVSDQPNAIDDFRHLNVTVTKVGFERAGEGGWVEYDVDDRTVDLTRLEGANATLLDEYDPPNGSYQTVFVHVGEVTATLENGEQVRVKLPSEKLQIETAFTVDDASQVEFVFDIAVHEAGNSGKYVLRPVVSESGTDVPIERVDGDEDELTVTPVGDVSPGGNATLEVTRDGEAVANATVAVDDETVGTTDADGRITVAVPADELEVEVEKGGAEGELEVEFEDDDRERADDDSQTDDPDEDPENDSEADDDGTDEPEGDDSGDDETSDSEDDGSEADDPEDDESGGEDSGDDDPDRRLTALAAPVLAR